MIGREQRLERRDPAIEGKIQLNELEWQQQFTCTMVDMFSRELLHEAYQHMEWADAAVWAAVPTGA